MITSLTYNCDPDSLDGISQEAFSEAFEAELMLYPQFRECAVTVTFEAGLSRLVSVAGYDLPDDLEHYLRDTLRRRADRAFELCCNAE